MKPSLFSVLLLSTSALLAAPAETSTLLDWSTAEIPAIRVIDYRAPLLFTPLRAKPRGVKFHADKTGDQTTLTLEISAESELFQPGILIRPSQQQRFWDLSGYQELHVDVENLDRDQQGAIRCRVLNATIAGSYQTSTDSGLTLNPGEKATLKVRYYHAADENPPCTMFGVGSTPPGIPSVRTINTRRVDGISFFTDAPRYYNRKGSLKLRFSNIRLAVPRQQPSPAVKDPAKFYPFIDRYGQYKHDEWKEKIHTPADFKRLTAEESAHLRSAIPAWNRFGGWANGPSLKATGFFRVEKYQGKCYLVDPEGKLFFSFGLNSITMGEADLCGGKHPDKWFETPRESAGCRNFTIANLKQRYGENYLAQYPDLIFRRLASWGVNTVGNWSSLPRQKAQRMPYVTNIVGIRGKFPKSAAVPMRDPDSLWEGIGYPGLWDVFDPGFAVQLKRHAAMLKKQLPPDDPYCIGIIIDNEIRWGHNNLYGDRTAVARSVLLSPAELVAKQEFTRLMREKYGDIAKLNAVWHTSYKDWEHFLKLRYLPELKFAEADMIEFNRHFIEHYYRFCRDLVRSYFPNHLYLGSRINLLHLDVMEIASRYTDVMTLNVYTFNMEGLTHPGLPADKPLIVTEFQVGVPDRGMYCAQPRQAGVTQEDRARAYRRILEGLLRHPAAVGAHFFAYRDQPMTGRHGGPWQENFAVGVIDKCDTPYQELTDAMREVAEKGLSYRLNTPANYDIQAYNK